MKKLLLILLCLPMIGFGQGWKNNYGGTSDDLGYSVQQTNDGGYIITGSTESLGNGLTDVYLIKTDTNGDSSWTKTFGGIYEDVGYDVQQTTDGGYIITGSPWSGPGRKIYLVKTDTNGVEQWAKSFGLAGDMGWSVKQTTDGGYIIVGITESSVKVSEAYILLLKADSIGTEQWTKTFGALNGVTLGYSVQQTTEGGYVITGRAGSDVFLLKTDTNGVEQWSKTFSAGEGWSVQQTTDGGYIIVGGTSPGGGPGDVYLIKTNGNGVEEWNKIFGGAGTLDEGRSVQQTNDGGYIICGVTSSFGNGMNDVYLIKTDGTGVEEWSKTFGGINDDEGYSVQQTTDGGYIIAGYLTSSWSGNSDVYLIKTDGNGNVTSTFNIPINPNRKLQKTVDMLGKETKPKTNTPLIKIYDDGTVEKRIVIE